MKECDLGPWYYCPRITERYVVLSSNVAYVVTKKLRIFYCCFSSIASSIGAIHEHRSISRNSHSPAASDSGISVDGPGSSGSGANTPHVNLAELAKHGSLGVNAQGTYQQSNNITTVSFWGIFFSLVWLGFVKV